ncbi:MAG: lactate racemase domain-containing protein [Planctomycetota bacterium]
MHIPALTLVKQIAKQPEVKDVAGETLLQWKNSGLQQKIKSGSSVAIGVGSRGIANLAAIVKATIEYFKGIGAKPFIVSAMGSHGGANAQGQRELLGEYGISEENLGVTVKTDMDSVVIGKNSWNEPVYWDKNALAADAVVTISRIKPHTDFRGRFESGIAKMLVIGLGKREGASQHHRWGFKGLRDMLPETAKVILEKTNFLGGLAVLENAHEQTAKLEFVSTQNLMEVEPKLLDEARQLLGKLPFHDIDLLVVGEIGKNYSGAGIDPNVVGRLLIEGQNDFETPKIIRMCALDLSPESHGNGTGVGIADLTTDKLLASIDQVPFRMNNLTACFLWRSKLPIAFPNDKECIQTGLETCWQPDLNAIRMVVVPNSLELAELYVSAPLLEEVRKNKDLAISGDSFELQFDDKGNLNQKALFPHSAQGRRVSGHH